MGRVHALLMIALDDVALTLRNPDALFQDLERRIDLALLDDQRRREPDRCLAAAQNQKAALEGEIDDAVAQ